MELIGEAGIEPERRIVVAEISFQSDGDGRIKSLTLHQAGMDRVAEKIE